MDDPIRVLSMVVVFLLLIMLASIHAALKRNLRMERKMDAVMQRLGIGDQALLIDAMGARHTKLAAIAEGDDAELYEGSSSRSAAHGWIIKPPPKQP